MKKIIALMMVAILAVALLAGCAPKETTPSTEPSASDSAEPSASESSEPSTQPSEGGAEAVKTGLGIVNSITSSKDATADEEGLAQANSVIVALTVDSNGVINDCAIDMAQSKANFNAAGEITTPLDTEFMTKDELGADYGMGKVSEIGKEWNEQAEAFAQYVIGKTLDEVKGIALDEEGHATDSDLTASVTIHVNEFIEGVEKAVMSAADLGAMAGDTVSIGAETSIARSANATAEEEGNIEFYSYYTGLTMDDAGTITSCVLDASQSVVNFDTSGMITNDLTVAPMTKNELKDDYGMKKASGIGKEWYEEAAAFAAYVTGMTIEEVNGISVVDGYAGDEDLKASVTIHIADFLAVINKAAAM